MQTVSHNVIEHWNQKFLSISEQCNIKSRHSWIHFKPEQTTFTQFCIYKQCKHCKKFLTLYIDKANSGSLFFDKNFIYSVSDKLAQKNIQLSICERLLIMK